MSTVALILFCILPLSLVLIVRLFAGSQSRGAWMEQKVAQKLSKLPQEEYITLNDLMFESTRGTTQIDHVVISIYGVFVIEAKNYSGRIVGNENSEYWEMSIYGYRYKTGNALRQNKGHIAAVRYNGFVNRDVPIHNIVVFANKTNFDIHHAEGMVIYLDSLIPVIKRFCQCTPIMSIQQVQQIAANLQRRNIVDPEKRKAHNQDVLEKISQRDNKIREGICPQCGGQLVQRKGSYGYFYGCSNYPTCHFNIKDLNTNYDSENTRRKYRQRFKRRARRSMSRLLR
jgi:hypothetical protein